MYVRAPLFKIWVELSLASTFEMMLHLTCLYKVAVERMGIEIIADRFGSSNKGLTDYLTPKQTLTAGHPVVPSSGGK